MAKAKTVMLESREVRVIPIDIKYQEPIVKAQSEEFHFGYALIGNFNFTHPEQQDALSWQEFSISDIRPKGENTPLSPQEIGHRMWTTLRELNYLVHRIYEIDHERNPDKSRQQSGTTVSVTVYDGNNCFITATLGDAEAMAIIYDKAGNPIGVTNLNSTIHCADSSSEKLRLKQTGVVIVDEIHGPKREPYRGVFLYRGRLHLKTSTEDSSLNITRGVGDEPEYHKHGFTSGAKIDIHSMDELIQHAITINGRLICKEDIGSVQLVHTSDGFFAEAPGKDPIDHAHYLLEKVISIKPFIRGTSPGKWPESELAYWLCTKAIKDGSMDNLSFACHTLAVELDESNTVVVDKRQRPFLQGDYDGHGGKIASSVVSRVFGDEFAVQCQLPLSDYPKQFFSVNRDVAEYSRDNIDPIVAQTMKHEFQEPVHPNKTTFELKQIAIVHDVVGRILAGQDSDSIPVILDIIKRELLSQHIQRVPS